MAGSMTRSSANHWSGRSGGYFESEGYCAIAGETLSYFHQRVLELHGGQTPRARDARDFNDEPFEVSMVRHALSTRQRAKFTFTQTVRNHASNIIHLT
jgi:hypothetical protein